MRSGVRFLGRGQSGQPRFEPGPPEYEEVYTYLNLLRQKVSILDFLIISICNFCGKTRGVSYVIYI
jgi:hypothetical protein